MTFAPDEVITSEEIVDLRRRLHLTQAQLAARIGATVDAVRNWERKRRSPSGLARKALFNLRDTVT